MRVLIVGHWFLNRTNQAKLDRLAEQPGIELVALMPRRWRGSLGEVYGGPGRAPRRWRARRGQTVLEGGVNISLHLYISGLVEALRAHRPHLVQVDEEPYCPVSFQVALLKPVFGYRMVSFSYQNVAKRYPPPFRWIERAALARADLLVGGNAEALQVMRGKGYRGPTEVIPHGIDLALYRDARPAAVEGLDGGRFTVGFAGRLETEKGIGVLLEALARLPDRPQLLAVGGGAQAGAVRGAPCTVLVPRVPHAAVGRYLKRMDLLVVPSLAHAGWKEQLGRVILEAMAAGVPVVASDSGEIPRTTGGAGLLVPEGDAAALAAAIERLRAAPAEREALRARGLARASEFGWDTVARALAAAWRRTLAKPAAGGVDCAFHPNRRRE